MLYEQQAWTRYDKQHDHVGTLRFNQSQRRGQNSDATVALPQTKRQDNNKSTIALELGCGDW